MNYVIGELLHCSRLFRTDGAQVRQDAEGRPALAPLAEGSPPLPVPEPLVECARWRDTRRVPPVGAALWQLLNGAPPDAAAGRAYLRDLVRVQQSAGAFALDLNVDGFSSDPAANGAALRALVAAVQESVDLPLCIDSSSGDLLALGLSLVDPARPAPLLNSVSLSRFAELEPLLSARSARLRVVAAANDSDGSVPTDPDARFRNLSELVGRLRSSGFPPDALFLDPLVLPVCVGRTNGASVLSLVRRLRDAFGPAIHFAPGLSNVSFGLPNRPLLNLAFAWLAREAGCDGAIADPRSIHTAALDAFRPDDPAAAAALRALRGEDEDCLDYLESQRTGQPRA